MKRHLQLALALACTISIVGCTSKPDSAEPATSQVSELDAPAASQSFRDKVESKLEDLQIAEWVSSALVRATTGVPEEEIVYTLGGLGNARSVELLLLKLNEHWHTSNSPASWMPWERVTETAGGMPGPFLGAFREGRYQDGIFHDGEFKLTLWTDRHGDDLFICYTAPIPPEKPTEAAAEGTPSED